LYRGVALANAQERAIKGRTGSGRSKRRAASIARSTATNPRIRVGRRCKPSRLPAGAAKRARKTNSETLRAKLRGYPKAGKIRGR
jgi:hypothetical protein